MNDNVDKTETKTVLLSRKPNAFLKWGYPFIFFLAVVVAFFCYADASSAVNVAATSIGLFVFGCFYYISVKRHLWNVVDRIVERGNELYIQSGRTADKISLSDIRKVTFFTNEYSGTVAVLDLLKPCAFGTSVRFYLNGDVAEQAIKQLESARTNGPS